MTSTDQISIGMTARNRSPEGSHAVYPHGGGVAPWVFGLLLVAIAVFHVMSLRAGAGWGDDFALYLLHARNIAEGRNYADTGYIYNSANPRHSPGIYPPGFPLLLAPLYALVGPNLFVLRLIVVASLVAAVAAFAALLRPVLPVRLILIVAALVGFQPYFIEFKNLLLPDFTFLLFSLLSLLLIRRLQERPAAESNELGWAVAAGACIYFALALRITGVALFGAVLLYHVLAWRRPSTAVLVSVVIALVLYALQLNLLPSAPGYAAQFADLPAGHVRNVTHAVVRLAKIKTMFSLTDVMWTGISWGATVFLMFATGLLAAIGYVIRIKRLSVVETFVMSYGMILLIFPFNSARYLIPLIPFLLYYGIVGIIFLNDRGGRPARVGGIALACVVAAVYGVNIATVDRRPFRTGVTDQVAEQLYDYVRQCTSPTARFVAQRPRALALYTRRSAMTSGTRLMGDNATFLRFVQSARIDHVITTRNTPLEEITSNATGAFTLTFENRRYRVYRFEPRATLSSDFAGDECSNRVSMMPASIAAAASSLR